MTAMIEWARPRRAYAAGWEGRAGSIRLFNISWDSLSSAAAHAAHGGRPWVLRTLLPGYEGKSWHRETEDEAKSIAVLVLTRWLESIGAQMKPATERADEPAEG